VTGASDTIPAQANFINKFEIKYPKFYTFKSETLFDINIVFIKEYGQSENKLARLLHGRTHAVATLAYSVTTIK